ncbi:contactin-6-like [Mercenaria mercenaria]|uniref:contactin-6-like n=1 Tax=Mercenaria mercenaria TaxID=6596 RepID=UPI00234F3B24|nr:contactin-6-like [Mercenaria mercenaria]
MFYNILLSCVFVLIGFINLASGEMPQYSNKEQNRTKEILEGGSIDIVCNNSGHGGYFIYWQSSDKQFHLNGSELLITNIERGQTGLYVCYAVVGSNSEVIDYIFIDVLYPAKILLWETPSYKLYQNDTLNMVVQIEGNPPPTTMIISEKTSRVVFKEDVAGSKNVTIEPVKCNDMGTYFLQSVNRFSSVSLTKNITVYCVPYANPDVPTTFDITPRLGEEAVLEMHAAAYPRPNYTWWHNGRNVEHLDDGYTSNVKIENMAVDDYGSYHLEMENPVGVGNYIFHIIPTGPPEPTKNLTVLKSTSRSVTLSWVSGYDYNDTQTFFVIKHQSGGYTNLAAFKDLSDYSGDTVTHTIDNLKPDVSYNVSVIANNKNGQYQGQFESVTFTTQGSQLSTGLIVSIVISASVVLSLCLVGICIVCMRNKCRSGYKSMEGSIEFSNSADSVPGKRV